MKALQKLHVLMEHSFMRMDLLEFISINTTSMTLDTHSRRY